MRRVANVRQLDQHVDVPLKVGNVLVVVLRADLHNLLHKIVAVRSLGILKLLHQLLDDIHQVALGDLIHHNTQVQSE